MPVEQIYNYIKVNDDFSTSGQPTEEQIRALAEAGFSNIINLATIEPGQSLENEDELAHTLGLNYYHIPVVWVNPKMTDFASFEEVMLQLPEGKTLIHCHANFRVTAFYSLFAQKHLGWTAEQAEAFRARIWKDNVYPVWQEFIALVQSEIHPPSP